MVITPCITFAQFGIKAGLNFANVSKAGDINSSSKSGFNAGIIIAPTTKGVLSYRSEYIFSRQGYNYATATNTGNVNLDYIQTSQLMSINITKYFSLLFGAQTSYLISAKADSTSNSNGSEMEPANKVMDLYNRIDYGYAVGAEVHPYKGLTIGAKYNVSLAKIYKDVQNMQAPSFTSADAKNNVIQLYVGWRFGKNEKKSPVPNKQ